MFETHQCGKPHIWFLRMFAQYTCAV